MHVKMWKLSQIAYNCDVDANSKGSHIYFLIEIIKQPKNMTVFLNQSAEFECETSGGLSGWKVDGTLYNILPAEIRSDLKSENRGVSEEGNSIIALTIPGRNVYNETNIQCVTGEFGGNLDESETVLLKIQGDYAIIVSQGYAMKWFHYH